MSNNIKISNMTTHIKSYIWILCLLIATATVGTIEVQAQCSENTHSNTTGEGWVSCMPTANPNPARGTSHWLQYDFGEVYALSTTFFWNSNEVGETDRGLQNLVIDYSIDGVTWTEWGTYTLMEATGMNDYLGTEGPDLTGVNAQYLLITAIDNFGDSCYGIAEIRFDVDPNAGPAQTVQLNVFLQGAYEGSGIMSTELSTLGLIPAEQPFSNAPWYYGGGEIATIIPANTTDWVLVEARSQQDPDVLVSQAAALLLSDGSIIDPITLTPGVNMEGLIEGNLYYIAVKARNHLAVYTQEALQIPNDVPADFTNPANITGGTDQLVDLGDGNYGLYAGDINSDGVITIADLNVYISHSSLIYNYVDSDLNYDSNVTVSDFNFYLPNSSIIGAEPIRYD